MKKCFSFAASACAVLLSLPVCASDIRLAPMGRIIVNDADVTMSPIVYYPGWTGRDARGGYRPEKDGSRRWRIGGKEYSTSSGVTNFTGVTKAVSISSKSSSVAEIISCPIDFLSKISHLSL